MGEGLVQYLRANCGWTVCRLVKKTVLGKKSEGGDFLGNKVNDGSGAPGDKFKQEVGAKNLLQERGEKMTTEIMGKKRVRSSQHHRGG